MTRTGTIVTLMNMEWMHGTWRAAACKFSIAAPGKSGSPYRQRRLFAGAAAPGTCGKVAIPVIFPAAMSPRLLFTIVFIEGYCSLGGEIIALRRLIPHVGSSIVVTAPTIGLFLLALALGYHSGSRVAANYRGVVARNFLDLGRPDGCGPRWRQRRCHLRRQARREWPTCCSSAPSSARWPGCWDRQCQS
jgi:hypothetical protein